MSDAAERHAPDPPDPSDQTHETAADAWATACEEDLAAEKARRRAAYGPQYGSAAEELRRLAEAVSEKVAELGRPFGGAIASAAAQGVAQQLVAQAKAAIGPVVERNPQVFDHLAAAGGELLSAYRAAVQEAEGRWAAGASVDVERIDLDKGQEESADPRSADPPSADPRSADPRSSGQPEAGGPDGPGAESDGRNTS
jgi:hypothetical protein